MVSKGKQVAINQSMYGHRGSCRTKSGDPAESKNRGTAKVKGRVPSALEIVCETIFVIDRISILYVLRISII